MERGTGGSGSGVGKDRREGQMAENEWKSATDGGKEVRASPG